MPAETTRRCGPCTACCAMIAEIGARVGDNSGPCGCRPDPTRESGCQGVRCFWLQGFGEGRDRPDRLGVVFAGSQRDDGTPMALAWETRPGAITATRATAHVEHFASQARHCWLSWSSHNSSGVPTFAVLRLLRSESSRLTCRCRPTSMRSSAGRVTTVIPMRPGGPCTRGWRRYRGWSRAMCGKGAQISIFRSGEPILTGSPPRLSAWAGSAATCGKGSCRRDLISGSTGVLASCPPRWS